MNHENTVQVRRSLLPEVLYADDIAVALDLTRESVDGHLEAGAFGPILRVANRPAVLREDFLEVLGACALARDGSSREVLRGV